MEKKHPAEIVAEHLKRSVEQRRLEALRKAREGDTCAIIYLWYDRYGFVQRQG